MWRHAIALTHHAAPARPTLRPRVIKLQVQGRTRYRKTLTVVDSPLRTGKKEIPPIMDVAAEVARTIPPWQSARLSAMLIPSALDSTCVNLAADALTGNLHLSNLSPASETTATARTEAHCHKSKLGTITILRLLKAKTSVVLLLQCLDIFFAFFAKSNFGPKDLS